MIKNLAYHICPTANWEWNLDQLKPYFYLFDGRKVFAVSTGKGMEPVESVRKKLELANRCYEIIAIPNDKELRETVSLLPLLQALRHAPEDSITFYGHTKGVTRGDDEAVMRWTRMMYWHNLSRVDEVQVMLYKFPCVGAFKRYGRYPEFPPESRWHYSGTFFWFRNSHLYKKKWEAVPMVKYGAEGYLSTLFPEHQAGCIYGDHARCLYTLSYTKKMEEDYERRARQARKR